MLLILNELLVCATIFSQYLVANDSVFVNQWAED